MFSFQHLMFNEANSIPFDIYRKNGADQNCPEAIEQRREGRNKSEVRCHSERQTFAGNHVVQERGEIGTH